MVSLRSFSFAAVLLAASTISARAVDEIQVYNAEIAKVGQWTFQLHNNYAFTGRKEPDFPGGLIPNHALQGTGEWAWGITEWWEIAVCARPRADALFQCRQDPTALRHSQRSGAGVLLRHQFRVQLRHAAILRDPVEHGDPSDCRLA
jgi:hypothetical protein